MNQKYFFIFSFLFSFDCSNTQSSLKNHFKTFFSRTSSKVGISLLSIAIVGILVKKFYSKKNHRKNNTSFKNSAPALPDNHLDDAKPVQKKIITAIELTPLQQEHENEKNILRKISALKKARLLLHGNQMTLLQK